MKKLILCAVLLFAISRFATAQTTQPTPAVADNAKTEVIKTDEKSHTAKGIPGKVKGKNKKTNSGSVLQGDAKISVPVINLNDALLGVPKEN